MAYRGATFKVGFGKHSLLQVHNPMLSLGHSRSIALEMVKSQQFSERGPYLHAECDDFPKRRKRDDSSEPGFPRQLLQGLGEVQQIHDLRNDILIRCPTHSTLSNEMLTVEEELAESLL